MKKKMRITLLALVFALLMQIACAEPVAVVQGVFDALTQEDSVYNQSKAMYTEYFEGIQWEEAVEGDSIVISIANGEFMDGSWTFTQEGDYLTATFDGEDHTGLFFAMSIEKNPARGWDVEAYLPLADGADIFKTTIYYDCDVNGFIYDKGKFWDAPTADSGEAADLGEAKIAGATGCFYLGGDSEDMLTWQDDEHPEDAAAFVRAEGTQEAEFAPPAPAEAPTVEALAEGYFNVLANMESGAAGASLKTAIAAGEVCAFAEAHELYNPDVEPLRANMLAAFEALDEDGQAAFWTNFDIVRALLDDCLENYDANRAVFEDAGVAEAMDEVMYDPLNRLAWENLRDHTLTIGNDGNVG